jgi:hypothetical protein
MTQAAKSDRVLLSVLALSLAGNVYLGVRAVPQRTAPNKGPEQGVRVTSLELHSAAGVLQPISFKQDPRPVLLYVFTTKCPWCAKNRVAIEMIAKRTSETHRFVPLCLDCTAEHTASLAGVPAFTRPSEATVLGYHLGSVPLTMVISNDGIVQHVWRGAYVGGTKTDVERTFGVLLPSTGATSD